MVHTTRKPVQSVHSSIYSTNPTGWHLEVLGDKDGVWSISGPRVQGRTTPRRTWTSPIFPPGPLTILPLPVWTTFNRLPRPLVRLDQQGVLTGIRERKDYKVRVLIPPAPSLQGCLGLALSPSQGTRLLIPSFLSMTPSNHLQYLILPPAPSLCTWGKEHYYWPQILPWKKKKVKVLVAQSCPTPCDPIEYSPPGSSIHGIIQTRLLQWVAIPFSRGSSRPRDWTRVSCMQILYCLSHQGSPIFPYPLWFPCPWPTHL